MKSKGSKREDKKYRKISLLKKLNCNILVRILEKGQHLMNKKVISERLIFIFICFCSAKECIFPLFNKCIKSLMSYVVEIF